mmetsp:Transcript_931/g.2156  ORF Transcript_931/g.2156 Transcript_931/m.2156 type:complete len:215 (+) Transcript_931:32-676(+)
MSRRPLVSGLLRRSKEFESGVEVAALVGLCVSTCKCGRAFSAALPRRCERTLFCGWGGTELQPPIVRASLGCLDHDMQPQFLRTVGSLGCLDHEMERRFRQGCFDHRMQRRFRRTSPLGAAISFFRTAPGSGGSQRIGDAPHVPVSRVVGAVRCGPARDGGIRRGVPCAGAPRRSRGRACRRFPAPLEKELTLHVGGLLRGRRDARRDGVVIRG